MNQDMIEDEVLSDTHSSLSSRRNSSISSHMANTNTRSRRGSIIARQSSVVDTNENKQSKQQAAVKVLVFNGKCSQIFKSTVEDCVEDCILEFPGEKSIYVPRSGQAGGKQTSALPRKDSGSNLPQSARTQRRRSSVTQFNFPQIGGTRTNQTGNLSLPAAALTVTSASRMRHQLVQQKFSFAEDISEEATDLQTTIEQVQNPAPAEPDSEHPRVSQDETASRQSNFDVLSRPTSSSPQRKFPSAPAQLSYQDRQKDYRLSDLVMLGPEYFAHVFNLPRPSRSATRTPSRQRSSTQHPRNKTAEKYSELDEIKQDLFHRYLWTLKPQVSCRIRPMATYTRSSTFVI